MSLTSARIRALNAVIDEGSYSAAARRLGMSQPAVSQSIRDIERSFGVTLFERRGRHLIPTDLCLELAPLANEIRKLEDAAQLLLREREIAQTGVLRIGIGSLTPAMTVIGAFQQRFPKVQVQVEYAIFSEVLKAVQEREVDIGVLPDVPDDGRFHKQFLVEQDVVALVPMGHPLAGETRLALRDLTSERLIFQQRGSVTQKLVDRAFQAFGQKPHASLVLKTHGEVYEAVAAGLGIGFIWRHGTSRKDGARRIPIAEINAVHKEELFRRRDTRTHVIDLFFSAAETLELAL